MNLEKLKMIIKSDKFLLKEMTNSDWQKYLSVLKLIVRQSTEKSMKCSYPTLVNGYYDYSYSTYSGDTQWQSYCKFINGVLRTIRKGECDYCYHIYQISDLLRFEHDNLEAVWLPEFNCFEVYLKK